MKAVKLPAIFSGIRSRKDRSYTLSFETRELGGKDAAELLGVQQSECWLVVAATEDAVDRIELPAYRPDSGAERKTPSQRQRAVMFLYWKQRGGETVLGPFDSWYAGRIERLIERYKLLLDDDGHEP